MRCHDRQRKICWPSKSARLDRGLCSAKSTWPILVLEGLDVKKLFLLHPLPTVSLMTLSLLCCSFFTWKTVLRKYSCCKIPRIRNICFHGNVIKEKRQRKEQVHHYLLNLIGFGERKLGSCSNAGIGHLKLKEGDWGTSTSCFPPSPPEEQSPLSNSSE